MTQTLPKGLSWRQPSEATAEVDDEPGHMGGKPGCQTGEG
jgi:hypothetical protein